MFQFNTRQSLVARRHVLLAALCAAVFVVSALPASAATAVSTFKTGILAVPAGQSISISVVDVANSTDGGYLDMEFFDAEGDSIRRSQHFLSKGKAFTLSLNADDVPFVGPFLEVRAVITIRKDLTSDLIPMTTMTLFDPVSLTTETPFSCVGPSASDDETEFNGGCPGVWQATEIIF